MDYNSHFNDWEIMTLKCLSSSENLDLDICAQDIARYVLPGPPLDTKPYHTVECTILELRQCNQSETADREAKMSTTAGKDFCGLYLYRN